MAPDDDEYVIEQRRGGLVHEAPFSAESLLASMGYADGLPDDKPLVFVMVDQQTGEAHVMAIQDDGDEYVGGPLGFSISLTGGITFTSNGPTLGWSATVETADTVYATASTAPDSHRSTSQTASTATKSRGTPYRPQGRTRAPVLTTAPIHRRRHRARPYARRSCTRGASTSTVDPPRPAASVPLIRSPRLSILNKGVTAIK